jgi:hypothetical protein
MYETYIKQVSDTSICYNIRSLNFDDYRYLLYKFFDAWLFFSQLNYKMFFEFNKF